MKFRDGIIVGGNCDKEHTWRRQREMGASIYVNHLVNIKILKIKKGTVEIKRKTLRSFPNPLELRRQGIFKDGYYELGAWRSKDVFKMLMSKKIFKLKLKKFYELLNNINAPISSIGTVVDMVFKGKSDQPIAADHIYKMRKKRGDFDK